MLEYFCFCSHYTLFYLISSHANQTHACMAVVIFLSFVSFPLDPEFHLHVGGLLNPIPGNTSLFFNLSYTMIAANTL